MADVALLVNGRRYGGWQSVRVTRSIESIAGSFELSLTDRWSGQDEPWAIAEEDECRVQIDGATVIDGYVDRRSISISSSERSMSVSGRDRAGVLVDCSAMPAEPAGTGTSFRWTYRKIGLLDFARRLAQPFGITVAVQSGLTLPAAAAKIVVNPGDSAFQAIEREAQAAGVLVVSDGAGGIVLTRAGTGRATALVQGHNVLAASVEYDATERYRRYVVATQIAGTDNASGGATRIRAEASDEGVRRADRVLMIRPDAGITVESARRRGDWEARIRAARAETVSVVVHGWQQPSGALWPLNALTHAEIPAIGVDGDMLISEVSYSLGESGELTTLRMVRPDAFTPEPRAVVKKGGGDFWKTLTVGDG